MASFIVFFLLTAAAATLGAIFTPGEWYAALFKPALTPPDWIFPVVWTVLWMAVASQACHRQMPQSKPELEANRSASLAKMKLLRAMPP